MTDTSVEVPIEGITIAVQYWAGDETKALRLARLLADIEPEARQDVTLALVRRFDCPMSEDADRTLSHCRRKFSTCTIRAERDGIGHPNGANGLWGGCMEQLTTLWRCWSGRPAVFTIEHDGVPLCNRWIDVLLAERRASLREGKRVTGALSGTFTDQTTQLPHLNGSLIMECSFWLDHPSIHETPNNQAWDLFHAPAIWSEGRATKAIANIHGSVCWSSGALVALGREVAWLASVKDDSALEWAERTLVTR